MNPDSENFEQLRRLLALKRHEVPPPGYFNNFSSKIIARIEAGEHAETAVLDGSWLQRLWMLLEGKPAVFGAFGAAVCGLLVAGVLNAERTTASYQPAVAVNGPTFTPVATPAANSMAGIPAVFPSSTDPVASSGGSLFDQVPLPTANAVNAERFILTGNQ